MKRLQPRQRGDSVSEIHGRLRRSILRGGLKPGIRLSQIRLCHELGVGRTPLREALRMLQQEGLIVAERNKRPRVVSFDPEMIDALAARMILLFSLAATVSVPALTERDLGAMEVSLGRMRRALETNDIEGWNRAHLGFHSRISVHAGGALCELLRQLDERTLFYRRFLMTGEIVSWSKIDEEHRAILDACGAHDAEKAAKLIARHLADAALNLMSRGATSIEPRLVRAAMRWFAPKPQLVHKLAANA